MKGSLHTDELMRAVTASATGLRTERRISHVFIMDVLATQKRCSSPTRRFPSTIEQAPIDAAALCKMADRGQITGGLLDGPLAFDNAIDPEAARIKGISSPVAGQARILVVPDLEAGNMLAKNLGFLAHADAAGIVLGARVPIILTSRADSVRTRLASCAVAVLYANARRAKAAVPAV